MLQHIGCVSALNTVNQVCTYNVPIGKTCKPHASEARPPPPVTQYRGFQKIRSRRAIANAHLVAKESLVGHRGAAVDDRTAVRVQYTRNQRSGHCGGSNVDPHIPGWIDRQDKYKGHTLYISCVEVTREISATAVRWVRCCVGTFIDSACFSPEATCSNWSASHTSEAPTSNYCMQVEPTSH